MRLATSDEVQLITREELKAKLDRGDDFKLVMVLEEWAYRLKHIPSSINIPIAFRPWGPSDLELEDEIVVYCSGEECFASKFAYTILKAQGYKNVWRYVGGIADWEDAGYPLGGEAASLAPNRGQPSNRQTEAA